MNLRAAASQTVSRPSFRELSMFEFTNIGGHTIYVFNIMAGYTVPKSRTYVSVLYNVFGRRIAEVGVSGTPDIYEEPFNRLDVVLTQPIGYNISTKLSASNLLNPNAKYKQGDEIQRIYKEVVNEKACFASGAMSDNLYERAASSGTHIPTSRV